jgi:hypothetical protein
MAEMAVLKDIFLIKNELKKLLSTLFFIINLKIFLIFFKKCQVCLKFKKKYKQISISNS